MSLPVKTFHYISVDDKSSIVLCFVHAVAMSYEIVCYFVVITGKETLYQLNSIVSTAIKSWMLQTITHLSKKKLT